MCRAQMRPGSYSREMSQLMQAVRALWRDTRRMLEETTRISIASAPIARSDPRG